MFVLILHIHSPLENSNTCDNTSSTAMISILKSERGQFKLCQIAYDKIVDEQRCQLLKRIPVQCHSAYMYIYYMSIILTVFRLENVERLIGCFPKASLFFPFYLREQNSFRTFYPHRGNWRAFRSLKPFSCFANAIMPLNFGFFPPSFLRLPLFLARFRKAK